ncbi:MAG: hypothetical protein JOZ62_04450, partial [Acidobacteriaceae bacterium]|nr:hypothetical protein [Acidobacteriaceae bacterium]
MLRRSLALVLGFAGVMALASAQDKPAPEKKPDPTPEQIQEIIKKFTQKETEFAIARENYTYRQS